MSNNVIEVGDRVDIKAGPESGSWGIVRLIVNGEYHVAIADSDTNALVFERSELLKRRLPMATDQRSKS